jgi:hypothetical protein
VFLAREIDVQKYTSVRRDNTAIVRIRERLLDSWIGVSEVAEA